MAQASNSCCLGGGGKRILSSKLALASNKAHSQQGQLNKTLFQKKKKRKEVGHSPVSKCFTDQCEALGSSSNPESDRLKEKIRELAIHFSDPCKDDNNRKYVLCLLLNVSH